ncbi:MAG TPA: tRNA dihydrouridine(20/20a) synthase DusA [Pseudomonadales bacterium]
MSAPARLHSPSISPGPSRRFCVAPMMDWTDRHCRYFMRLLTREALLYTEMVTTGALLHGDSARFLRHDSAEQPLALQLGGSDPAALAACAQLGEAAGYREINLNVGCPSDRVQNNRIGACLMAEPRLVADCVAAMQSRVRIPVTVKCRTGIDDLDSFDYLSGFVETVAGDGGCRHFIVHARIALLQGLSPKENREIPPLNYARVYRLKERFPDLEIVINGGIITLESCEEHLKHVDGVMLGREAYHNPWLLADVDARLFGNPCVQRTRHEAIASFLPYIERELAAGTPLHHMTRHMLGLFQGQPGGKRFRRHLSENVHRGKAGIDVLHAALATLAQHAPHPSTETHTPC